MFIANVRLPDETGEVAQSELHQKSRTLSAEERAAYDELGYVVVPDVFSGEELEAIDKEIDRLAEGILDQRRARGEARGQGREQPEVILQLGLRSAVCQQMAQDERVLTLIEDIVKPGIAIYSVKLITKSPRTDVPCHWHQDDAYYVSNSLSQTRMSAWIPLQDAHRRNGCLHIVPGSHRWGLRQHSKKDYGQCRLAMRDGDIEAVLRERAVPVPVPQGAVVLFSALLWHGSYGNETGMIRRAFITSYQEATAVRGNGAQWKILRSGGRDRQKSKAEEGKPQ